MRVDRNEREAATVAAWVVQDEARRRAAAAAHVAKERSRARLARYAERMRTDHGGAGIILLAAVPLIVALVWFVARVLGAAVAVTP